MIKSVFFIDSINELESLNFDSEKIKNSTIFSFNIKVHKFLEEKKIEHVMAETYLDEKDHKKIFQNSISFWNWYENNEFRTHLEFENRNLLSLMDTAELHQILVREIFSFLNLKRILEKEQPKEILCTNHFSNMINSIFGDDSLKITTYDKKSHEFLVVWDKILIRFNLGKKPISIPISRKKYNSFKNFFERLIGNFFNLNINFSKNKKSILFIELNPVEYSELIKNLKSFDGNLIFFNRRRSAIWNYNSMNILKKNNGKLISENLLLSNSEKKNISSLVDYYKKKLEILWSDTTKFDKYFMIEDKSFWRSISKVLFETYVKRLEEYMLLVQTSKNLFEKTSINCIVSLNTLGETEKAVLEINNSNVPSILLEHGATNYVPEIQDYDISNMYPIFKDKIALWGDVQKKYLTEIKKIPENRIFVTGSPRHEKFFQKQKEYSENTSKTILITPQVVQEFNGKVHTTSFIRIENLLQRIFVCLNKLSNVRVIVKMHPTLDPGNEYVKNLIHKINPNVEIFQTESIIDVIDSCDTVLNINTEFFPSTVMYESMIMNKPVLNIRMMDDFYNCEFVKDDAVLSISDKDNVETAIHDIIYDEHLRKSLIKNAQKHLLRYFTNQKNASEKLADLLKSF